jgi:hypothetical protein
MTAIKASNDINMVPLTTINNVEKLQLTFHANKGNIMLNDNYVHVNTCTNTFFQFTLTPQRGGGSDL